MWGCKLPFTPDKYDSDATPDGLIVALTRAQVKMGTATRFRRHVPNIWQRLGFDPNEVFKIGMGETLLFYPMTFSIWPDGESMSAFARGAFVARRVPPLVHGHQASASFL